MNIINHTIYIIFSIDFILELNLEFLFLFYIFLVFSKLKNPGFFVSLIIQILDKSKKLPCGIFF